MATIYKQLNKRWKNKPYKVKCTVGGSGCGLVSVVNTLNEYDKYNGDTPLDFYTYMRQGAVDYDGTKRDHVKAALKKYGFTDVQRFGARPMKEAWPLLAKGYRGVFVVGSSKGGTKKKQWTTTAHYIAIVDYEYDEKSKKHRLKVKDSSWRNNDGWYTYEEHMKGTVKDVIIGNPAKLLAKPEPTVVTAKKEETPAKKETSTYSGKLPTTKLTKSNAEVIADTIKWLTDHAADNSFHYGYTNKLKGINAHHNGCYYCGTNTLTGGRSKKGIVGWEKTYCCNPFIGAGFAHGGCVPEALTLCRKGTSWDFHKGRGYDTSPSFKKISKPTKAKLPIGAVLCRDTHVAMYIGNGMIVEAGGSDDNVRGSAKWNNSIRVTALTDANYKKFPRIYTYKGSVNTLVSILPGEYSERVELWQKYLNWYFDKPVVTIDGKYGDYTWKYTKEFQEKEIGKGQGDGYIGAKTLEAASKVKRG